MKNKNERKKRKNKKNVLDYIPSTTALSLFRLVPLTTEAGTFLAIDPTPTGVTSARIHGLALPGCWSKFCCCLDMLICRAIEISTALLRFASASSIDGFVR